MHSGVGSGSRPTIPRCGEDPGFRMRAGAHNFENPRSVTPSGNRWGNLLNVIRGKPIQFMSEHHVTEYSVGQVIEQLKYGGCEVIKSYSKAFKTGNWKFEAAKKLFSVFASLTGSHHQLESTVFYLAQRTQKNSRDATAVN